MRECVSPEPPVSELASVMAGDRRGGQKGGGEGAW